MCICIYICIYIYIQIYINISGKQLRTVYYAGLYIYIYISGGISSNFFPLQQKRQS